jgi:oxygen-dependent protoporphyrinogen oxidase
VETVIVGGGISGLAAAYYLNRRGVRPVLIEEQPRLGGLIETRRLAGCTLEAGPESFLASKPWAVELVRELGLGGELIGSNDHARRTFIVRNGRLTPMPEGLVLFVPADPAKLAGSDLLSAAARERIQRERDRQPSGELPERSVAEFVIDHFGEEVLDYLAEPLLAGVYGGDPWQLSASAVLPQFVELETRHGSVLRGLANRPKADATPASVFQSLKGGLGQLIDTLAARVEARVIREARCSVRAAPGGGFAVQAGGETIRAARLLVAVPAWAAAELLGALDAELAAELAAIPYTPSLTVALVYDKQAFDGPDGFGFLVPRVERRRVMASTWIGAKWAHRVPGDKVALRVFFNDEAILGEPDAAVLAIVRDELREIMGVHAAPAAATIGRWPASMPQYTLGHAARVARIFARAAAHPGLTILGNAYHGVGIPDAVRLARDAARA